ncbi:MAG: HypC/HybG/HupF family hydrogenase formation chaperone [Burkholderiales bacterium]|nr:HypC/HybG/HupF family hydrogenase formation chaperone [Burkholderiales bacterium]
MKILDLPSPGRALCEGRGQKENIDVLMLENPQVGEWVLSWNGMALEKLTPERAEQVDKALDSLEMAMNGLPQTDEDPFADITANTGKLPPYLAALVPKNQG